MTPLCKIEVTLPRVLGSRTVQPGAIVDNKRLSAVLEQVKAQQAAYPAHQQGPYCPEATAEQPRSPGSAVEGPSATPLFRRGAGLRQRTPIEG